MKLALQPALYCFLGSVGRLKLSARQKCPSEGSSHCRLPGLGGSIVCMCWGVVLEQNQLLRSTCSNCKSLRAEPGLGRVLCPQWKTLGFSSIQYLLTVKEPRRH